MSAVFPERRGRIPFRTSPINAIACGPGNLLNIEDECSPALALSRFGTPQRRERKVPGASERECGFPERGGRIPPLAPPVHAIACGQGCIGSPSVSCLFSSTGPIAFWDAPAAGRKPQERLRGSAVFIWYRCIFSLQRNHVLYEYYGE